MAGARGMVPEDNRVFDPELLMEEVIRYTHYMPDEWKDQLHSKQVKQSKLYVCTRIDAVSHRFIKNSASFSL